MLNMNREAKPSPYFNYDLDGFSLYLTPLKIKSRGDFTVKLTSHDDSTWGEVIEKDYFKGDVFHAIGIIDSDACRSAKGFVVYDKTIKQVFIVDIALFDTDLLIS